MKSLADSDVPWGIPLFCANEFVRVATHPVLSPPATTLQALHFLETTLEAPTCELLLPGERYRSEFHRLLREHSFTGNEVFDAVIAAVCIEHGVREIITEDRRFPKIRGLKITRLA